MTKQELIEKYQQELQEYQQLVAEGVEHEINSGEQTSATEAETQGTYIGRQEAIEQILIDLESLTEL